MIAPAMRIKYRVLFSYHLSCFLFKVKELVRVFKRGKGFGCGEFLRSAIISQRENFLPEGVITIALDISVFDKVENVDCSVMKLSGPESRLGVDIGALFNNNLHSDFTIVCKDSTFHAHKAILAGKPQAKLIVC